MKEVTGEISGFNKEILIYLSESCRFFYIQICIQFYYLEQLSLFYDFLDQKFYILYVYVPENNVSHTLAQFFFLSNLIHNLQTTWIKKFQQM